MSEILKIIITSVLRNCITYRRHLIVLWCRISYLLCWIGRLIAKLILRIEWTWSWILLCLSVGVGILIGLGLLGRGWTFEEIESNSLFRWLWRGFWFGTVCEIFFIMRKYHTVWSNQTNWDLKFNVSQNTDNLNTNLVTWDFLDSQKVCRQQIFLDPSRVGPVFYQEQLQSYFLQICILFQLRNHQTKPWEKKI